MRLLPRVLALTLAAAVSAPSLLAAQTGVSDNRVSLPDGAGSREGVGDDVRVTGNMGAMTFSVPIALPGGFAGMTPDASLTYSSNGGNGPVGIGWSMPTMSIERRTITGVPAYDLDDSFQSDGELVYVVGENPRAYRSRFEQGFAIHEWHSAGEGDEGYWVVRYPDGRVGYFGADADGTLVASARVGGEDGTFRYLLHEVVDRYGHRLVYEYEPRGGTSLLTSASYVFVDGTPQYEVSWIWGERPDPIVDATGGFEETLAHRLTDIVVTVRGTERSRYTLTYESVLASGGASRLAAFDEYGVGGARFDDRYSFGYASSLGAICDGTTCEAPFVRDLGSLGVDMQTGDPQLIDLNGDALPDIVDSSLVGEPHRIFFNELDADGTQSFAAPVSSALGDQDGFDFSNSRVQVVDIDGNGLSDAINTLTGRFLLNDGGLDWDSNTNWIGPVELPDFEADFSDGELQTIRFVDIDNDRRIDVLRSTGSGDANLTRVYRNTGVGFEVLADVDPILAGFDSDTLELNDMNGDGLLDPVQVRTSGVRYRLSLGNGHWAPADGWYEAPFDGPGLAEGELVTADLEDLNGDGLADVVLVTGSTVEVWVNAGGESLIPLAPISDDDVTGGSLPTRTSNTTVLYADMNGNGSSDVTWVSPGGDVTVLDLFPTRPHLMTRIENGYGMTIDVEYRSSVAFAAAAEDAGDAWDHALPFAQTVVSRVTRTEALRELPIVETFDYGTGYYDGVEKQFRGYAEVLRTVVGDDAHEGSVEVMMYDVGDTPDGPYTAGLLLSAELIGDDAGSLQHITRTYDDCPLADVPDDLEPAVRHICEVATVTENREGADPSEWLTGRVEMTYDGHGQVTQMVDHGTVALGGAACAPCDRESGEFGLACGAECLGDEVYLDRTYVEPGDATGGLWLLGAVHTSRSYGDPSADDYAESIHYYDGEAFVGLPGGELTRGDLTRVSRRRVGDTYIDLRRFAHDAHGNVIDEVHPGVDAAGWAGHTVAVMTDDGLRPLSITMQLDRDGVRYGVQKTYAYDDIFDVVVRATDWTVVDADGVPVNTPSFDAWELDAFGRAVAQRRPGDAIPTLERSWTYAADHMRATTEMRSTSGAAPDVEEHLCHDGFGRRYRTIRRVGTGEYVVSGDIVYDAKGTIVAQYFPWSVDSVDCAAEPPAGTGRQVVVRDAMGRPMETRLAEGDVTLERREFAYTPSEVTEWDPVDLDPSTPAFDTPTVRRMDGLGRVVAVGRVEVSGGEPAWYEATYSHRGDLVRLTDPLGNTRTQSHDLEGNVIAIDDADRGVITYEYDDASSVIREVDASPFVTVRSFDEMGRLVSQGLEGVPSSFVDLTWDFDAACPEARCTWGGNEIVSLRFEALGTAIEDFSGYDERSRRIWSRRTFDGVALDSAWAWDNLDRQISRTMPDGTVIEQVFNERGLVDAIPGVLDRVDRRADGRPLAMHFANGTEQRWAYEARAMPTEIEIFDGSGTRAVGMAYTWRADRTLDTVTDLEPLEDRASRSAAYAYDASGRLVEAALSMDVEAFAETVMYEYDLAENLVSRTSTWAESPRNDGARVIHADRPHAVTRVGELDINYDETGRVIRVGDRIYDRDGFGRIAGVEVDDARVEHGYGFDHDRVLTLGDDTTVVRVGMHFEVRDGVASTHVGYGTQTIAHIETPDLATTVLPDVAPRTMGGDVEPDGFITAGDAWVLSAIERGDLDGENESGRTANQVLSASANLGLLAGGDQTTWLHGDYNHNVVAVTDADGDVIETTVYAPFGSDLGRSASGAEPFGFTGERRDPNDGTLRIGPRGFDTVLGRWTEPDPLFETLVPTALDAPWEAMGTYQFGWNTPVNQRDETGFAGQDTATPPTYTQSQTRAMELVVLRWMAFNEVRPISSASSNINSSPFEGQNITHPLKVLARGGIIENNDPTANIAATSAYDPAILGFVAIAAEFDRLARRFGPLVRDRLKPDQQRRYDRLRYHRNDVRARLLATAGIHEIVLIRARTAVSKQNRRYRWGQALRLWSLRGTVDGANQSMRSRSTRLGLGVFFGNSSNRRKGGR